MNVLATSNLFDTGFISNILSVTDSYKGSLFDPAQPVH